MIDRRAELPIKRQAQLLGISRGTVYYHLDPVSEAELALMRRIDDLHLEHPFARVGPTRVEPKLIHTFTAYSEHNH
jgi:hypothetical protein